MWMNVKLVMEGVFRHALTIMVHLNVLVAQGTFKQLIILLAMVRGQLAYACSYVVIFAALDPIASRNAVMVTLEGITTQEV